MKALGNVLWLLLGGLIMALVYALVALVVCVFVVTIPFGKQIFKLAGYSAWPFGRTVVKSPDAGGSSLLGNVIWVIFAGWWLALGHLLSAVGNLMACVFIVTIPICGPFALAHARLALVALWPFGRVVVKTNQVGLVPPTP